MIDPKSVIQTLVELLETQEQIKVTYTLKEKEDTNEKQSVKSN